MSLFHVFTAYSPKDPDTVRRNTLAQSTWAQQTWRECPVQDEALPRMWREEGRAFPYIRDVFDLGCEGKMDSDILIHTNADIHVRSDCCTQIVFALQGTDAAYCFRRDFPRLNAALHDEQFSTGHGYAGHDLTAFRIGWWRAYRLQMPDMILGLEAWDPCIRVLIDRTNPDSDVLLHNLIAHERHGSFWENKSNRYRLRGQKLCLELAKAFLRAQGINPRKYGIL